MATHLERAITWEAHPDAHAKIRPTYMFVALAKAGMIDTVPNSAGEVCWDALNERGHKAVQALSAGADGR